MGLREWLNDHRGTTTGIVIAGVLVAIALVVIQVRANRHVYPTKLPDAFFSVDDGKTFFTAGMENIAPFDYGGREAVHAYVFECNGNRFVGYLERYTPEVRKAMLGGKHTAEMEMYGRELKKPGSTTWVKSGDITVEAKITDVHCPDGRRAEPVEP